MVQYVCTLVCTFIKRFKNNQYMYRINNELLLQYVNPKILFFLE